MATASTERRRSDRIWLTLPVHAEGVDSNGQPFECEARAISICRHGARLQIGQSLNEGQAVRLKSPTGDDAADFRVVASFAHPGEKDGEYGVECSDIKANFWGIEFPASDSDGPMDGKVLVECRKCKTIALLPLTLSEVEALRAMGLVGKPCPHCNTITLWRYAHVEVSPYRQGISTENSNGGNSADHPPNSNAGAPEAIERNHRRVYALMPVGVRDSQGSEEMTRTENISKGGFCFISGKTYQPGESVLAVFPHDSVTPKTELPAEIVRAQNIEGSDRKIYGAEYKKD
jgi:hypothetical protein